MIDYIQNYQKKPLAVNSLERDEVLALGHYCKSQNITINNLIEYISLRDFSEHRNIEFNEIKEVINRKL